MILSPRNKIDITNLIISEREMVDTLFEICDAEFNSRRDIHESFGRAKGIKSWARYVLSHEVKKIAYREHIPCGQFMAEIIANEISSMWFTQKENNVA